MRRQTLAISLASKALVVFPLAGLAGTASYILSNSYQAESALVAVGSTFIGLNTIWFYVGTGSPAKIIISDALPKFLLVSVSALALFLGSDLWVYPIIGILLPAIASAFIVIHLEGLSRTNFRGITIRRLAIIIRYQSIVMSGRALSALYTALPVTLVTLMAPQAVAVFAAIERLQRIYLQVLSAFPNLMQNWVGRSSSKHVKVQRALKAIWYNAGLGLVSGIAFFLLTPFIAGFVFSETVPVPQHLAAYSALLIIIVCTSRATGSITLVAFNRIRTIVTSALAGAAIGIPAILLGARFYGASGALAGEIIAEVVVLAVQINAVVRVTKFNSGP